MMMENPVSYSDYRAAIANQLLNRYGLAYADIKTILDMPGLTPGITLTRDLYRRGVSISRASKEIYERYEAVRKQHASLLF